MEQYNLDDDIRVLCVTATSFPDTIPDAFDRLAKLLGPSAAGRRYFGVSNKNQQGEIVYKAAAEARDGTEGGRFGVEMYTIKKGTYLSSYITGFRTNIQAIGSAFHEMLTDTHIDPQGACIEMYEGMDNVRCMVRLDPEKI